MEEETKAISEVSVTKVIEEVDQKDVNIKVSFSLHSLFNKLLSVKILLYAGKCSKLVVTVVFYEVLYEVSFIKKIPFHV